MAVDQFIKIDGIKGEAQDETHKDEIDVLAWSWGASNSGTLHVGSGAGGGKANVQDLSITKYVDNASPTLALHCVNGKHIKNAVLVVRKAGEKPLEYMTITLTDVIVTSYATGGSGGEDRLTENLSLNFAQIEYQYVVQKKDGTGGDKPSMTYHIAENKMK